MWVWNDKYCKIVYEFPWKLRKFNGKINVLNTEKKPLFRIVALMLRVIRSLYYKDVRE